MNFVVVLFIYASVFNIWLHMFEIKQFCHNDFNLYFMFILSLKFLPKEIQKKKWNIFRCVYLLPANTFRREFKCEIIESFNKINIVSRARLWFMMHFGEHLELRILNQLQGFTLHKKLQKLEPEQSEIVFLQYSMM